MWWGVISNVILNLNIYERTGFKNIYIFPWVSDEWTAAWAAILKSIDLWYDVSWLKLHKMPYWWDEYSKNNVYKELNKNKWQNKIKFKYLWKNWYKTAALNVSKGKIIALFNGKMEFWPRALGNRSIVANPCIKWVKNKINWTVKKRSNFQPFCPSVLEVEREKLFEKSFKHKHMIMAFRMKKKYHNILSEAIHIDWTARPQFIEQEDNLLYYNLISEVKKYTGYWIIINTSFNLHWRTIVRTPEDAITDFIDCKIDVLYIEGYEVKCISN